MSFKILENSLKVEFSFLFIILFIGIIRFYDMIFKRISELWFYYIIYNKVYFISKDFMRERFVDGFVRD